MSSLIIVASRHWQPMKAVDALIWAERPENVIAFGMTAVATRAIEASDLAGIRSETRDLEPGRASLINAAREPGAAVAVFVANDAATKQPSPGIAGIMARLTGDGVAYRRVDSPCTAKTCEVTTHLLVEVAKANDVLTTEWRRKKIIERLIARGLEADDLKRRLEGRLETDYDAAETSPERFAAWSMYLASYESLADALGLATKALPPVQAVSIRRGAMAA